MLGSLYLWILPVGNSGFLRDGGQSSFGVLQRGEEESLAHNCNYQPFGIVSFVVKVLCSFCVRVSLVISVFRRPLQQGTLCRVLVHMYARVPES